MKNKILIIALLFTFLLMPFSVLAKENGNSTLNFKDTLKDEEIKLSNTDYEETDDQITIYLFRGKGCGYCRAFLEYMNSISNEYGKYFKVVSYEVWNNSENASLMKDVAKFMNEEANGVPFIVIGDKVFTGYSESYNDKIKDAIKKLYDTPKEERYDVFVEMKKDKSSDKKSSNASIIVWNFIFIGAATTTIMIYNNRRFNALEAKINKSNKTIKSSKAKK